MFRTEMKNSEATLDLLNIYEILRKARGHQGWWPGEEPFEIVVGAVLTQNTAWKNVEKAIENLKAAQALDPVVIWQMDEKELANLIRPAGFFNVKAKRLRAVVRLILDEGNGDVLALGRYKDMMELRQRLLAVPGVGRETADSIMLYALGLPIFVVDAYTRRIFGRLGIVEPAWDYDEIRAFVEARLPRDAALFNDYHAQIVVHGKETCKKQPLCADCVLKGLCSSALGVT